METVKDNGQITETGGVKDKTLVIITHRLSTITHADQIIVLNNDSGIEEIIGDGDDICDFRYYCLTTPLTAYFRPFVPPI